MENMYGDSEDTRDKKIKEAKQKVKWGRDFFKF